MGVRRCRRLGGHAWVMDITVEQSAGFVFSGGVVVGGA